MNKNRVFNTAVGCAAVGVLLCGSAATAQTAAYDNLGPGNAFETGTGMVARGPDSGTPWAAFFDIVPLADGGVVEVSFPLHYRGHDNLFWFQIYDDNFYQPGTLLAEWETTGDPDNGLTTLTLDGSFDLEQGKLYWMGIMPGMNSHGTWRRNSFGETKDRWAWRGGPGTWTLYSNSNMSGLRVMVSEGGTCAPDINGDGVVDADDFFEFLSLFAAGDTRADFNNDGVIDADDFFMFLNLFAAGC